MQTLAMIELAESKSHLATMRSSAELCCVEARKQLDRGIDDAARRLAVKSLAYSLGILHPIYTKAHAAWTYGIRSELA